MYKEIQFTMECHKDIVFETNFDEKWTFYNNMEYKILLSKWNEPPLKHSNGQFSSKESVARNIVELKAYCELLDKQSVDLNKYCFPLNQLGSNWWKASGLS